MAMNPNIQTIKKLNNSISKAYPIKYKELTNLIDKKSVDTALKGTQQMLTIENFDINKIFKNIDNIKADTSKITKEYITKKIVRTIDTSKTMMNNYNVKNGNINIIKKNYYHIVNKSQKIIKKKTTSINTLYLILSILSFIVFFVSLFSFLKIYFRDFNFNVSEKYSNNIDIPDFIPDVFEQTIEFISNFFIASFREFKRLMDAIKNDMSTISIIIISFLSFILFFKLAISGGKETTKTETTITEENKRLKYQSYGRGNRGAGQPRYNNSRKNAPTFAYEAVYGELPDTTLSSRINYPHKNCSIPNIGVIQIDKDINCQWLRNLNKIKNIETRSSCGGHGKDRPTFIVFRMIPKLDSYADEVSNKLNKIKGLYSISEIGQQGRPRIIVAGKTWIGQKDWRYWWEHIVQHIKKAVDKY